MFKFEKRTCSCGDEWEALTFWPEDSVCGKCGAKEYAERLARINEGRPYVIDKIGGACPTQAEGTWIDGRRFYFRARHGRWWLYIDAEDPVAKWEYDLRGDDPSGGFMKYEDVLAILDDYAA
jgi:hypothetical protein